MKKISKLVVVTLVFAMLFTLPVMAREVSFSSENTDVLIGMLNANTARLNGELADFVKVQAGPGKDAIIAAQTALVQSNIAKVNKECAQNHLACLATKVYNAKQFEATRQAQYNWFKSLYDNSPSYIAEYNQASKDLAEATAARVAAENYLAAAQAKLAPYL
ncbi:MAG: hypothetical protein K6E16_02725 [Lachnospiraceae bacterium]|nr:hypothetical protein [Lachnospiraceae bacterium]